MSLSAFPLPLVASSTERKFADEDFRRIWDNGKYPVRLILNGEASKEIEWHCKVRALSHFLRSL